MPSLAKLSRTNTPEPNQADTKRRKSSVASLKALPLPFRNKSKDPIQVPATHTEKLSGTNLLNLPTELQLQVLRHLSFSDLCALRATSRDFNQSVTGPESAITRYWIASKLHNVHRLYPAPSHDQWRYLSSQMRRWNTARHLADMIARHIQYKTLLYVQRHSSSEFLSSSILAALLLPSVYSDQTRLVFLSTIFQLWTLRLSCQKPCGVTDDWTATSQLRGCFCTSPSPSVFGAG